MPKYTPRVQGRCSSLPFKTCSPGGRVGFTQSDHHPTAKLDAVPQRPPHGPSRETATPANIIPIQIIAHNIDKYTKYQIAAIPPAQPHHTPPIGGLVQCAGDIALLSGSHLNCRCEFLVISHLVGEYHLLSSQTSRLVKRASADGDTICLLQCTIYHLPE